MYSLICFLNSVHNVCLLMSYIQKISDRICVHLRNMRKNKIIPLVHLLRFIKRNTCEIALLHCCTALWTLYQYINPAFRTALDIFIYLY
jgi:hypothetical protein